MCAVYALYVSVYRGTYFLVEHREGFVIVDIREQKSLPCWYKSTSCLKQKYSFTHYSTHAHYHIILSASVSHTTLIRLKIISIVIDFSRIFTASKNIKRDAETAPSITYLLHKHQAMSSDSSTCGGTVLRRIKQNLWGSLASHSRQSSKPRHRNHVSKFKVENRERHAITIYGFQVCTPIHRHTQCIYRTHEGFYLIVWSV